MMGKPWASDSDSAACLSWNDYEASSRLLLNSKKKTKDLQRKIPYPQINNIIRGITHAGQQISTLGNHSEKKEKKKLVTIHDPSLKVIHGLQFQKHSLISPEKWTNIHISVSIW